MACIHVIPYSRVAISNESDRLYNTSFHTRDEITLKLPGFPHRDPDSQPWLLLTPWLDLMTSSQKLPPSNFHRIVLPPSFLLCLMHASPVGRGLGHVAESDVEDLEATFPKFTERGDSIANIVSSGRYFARLDTCSLKDAIVGEKEIKNVRDIWTRLATSPRAARGIQDLRNEDPRRTMYLYLFPWNEDIHTRYEYRVFCAPPHGEISAISQYEWHRPWHHRTSNAQEQHAIAERLVRNCRSLHSSILTHQSTTSKILRSGFVFDVVEDPQTQEVMLLELNDFGAMSGCGSCLFQWIEDAEMLYGIKEDETIQLRVTF